MEGDGELRKTTKMLGQPVLQLKFETRTFGMQVRCIIAWDSFFGLHALRHILRVELSCFIYETAGNILIKLRSPCDIVV